MKNRFADTSFFIALLNKRDNNHAKAVKLAEEKMSLCISDYVVAESVTLAGAIMNGKAGQELYEFFIDNCNIIFVDRRILDDSMQIFLKYDGTLSLTDAVSVLLMQEHDIREIVSFDRDFDKVDGIIRVH